MKFSKKFDEECRNFFRKVYMYYGKSFYEWDSAENQTILLNYPTNEGIDASFVDWLRDNEYVTSLDPNNYWNPQFTDKFIEEVINVQN